MVLLSNLILYFSKKNCECSLIAFRFNIKYCNLAQKKILKIWIFNAKHLNIEKKQILKRIIQMKIINLRGNKSYS